MPSNRVTQRMVSVSVVLIGVWLQVWAQTDLFISEYLETTSNKCIELFNPTDEPINLNGYKLFMSSNGATWSNRRNLQGVVSAKGTFVICHNNSSYPFDLNLGVGGFSGDDALALEKDGSFIDVFGNGECATPTVWVSGSHSTEDISLVRKPCITGGITQDPSGDCPFPTLTSEWLAFPPGTSRLGNHDNLYGLKEPVVQPLSDCGITDAAISIAADGNGLEYSINGGQTWQGSPLFTQLESGTYHLQVRTQIDASCQLNTSTVIDPLVPPQINDLLLENPGDCLQASGSVDVDAGFSPVEYSLDGGNTYSSNSKFDDLTAGNYEVTVRRTGTMQCLDTETFTLTDPPAPELQLEQLEHVSCQGFADGGIEISANLNDRDLNLNWNAPVNLNASLIQHDIPAGDYRLIAEHEDYPACRDTLAVEIMEPADAPPIPLFDPLPVICQHDDPYPLPDPQQAFNGAWSGAGVQVNTFDPSGLTQTITLTYTPDAMVCAQSTTLDVVVSVPREISLDLPESFCASQRLLLSPYAQGKPGVWSGSQVVDSWLDPQGTPGIYYLTFTPDSDICALSTTQPITAESARTPDIDLPETQCNLDEPLRLPDMPDNMHGRWSGPGVRQNLFDPKDLSGIQTLLFTPDEDQCGLPAQAQMAVLVAESPEISTLGTICALATPIALESLVDVSGQWSGTGVSNNQFDPAQLDGSHTLTFVPDDHICAIPTSLDVNVKTAYTPLLNLPDSVCQNSPPLNLLNFQDNTRGGWTGPGVDGREFNPRMVQGTAALTFTPTAAACAHSVTSRLWIQSLPAIDLMVTDIACADTQDGSITAVPLQPDVPLYYQLDSSTQSRGHWDSLAAGSYHLEITDALGCKIDSIISIAAPPPLTAFINPTYMSSGDSILLTTDISGGVPPYRWRWSNGSTLPNTVIAKDSDANLEVIDDNGCMQYLSFSDGQSNCDWDVSFDTLHPACSDSANGRLEILSPQGMIYQWNHDPALQSPFASDLPSGTYQVTIQDTTADCEVTEIILLEAPEPLAIQANTGYSTSAGGHIDIQVSGGALPYRYLWDNGDTLPYRESLAPGNYTVTVTDQNDCSTMQDFEITTDSCALAASVEWYAGCEGAFNGSATVETFNAVEPINFVWNHNAALNSPQADSLGAGQYEVTVTDAAGCSQTLMFDIDRLDYIFISISSSDESELGANDGWATASIQGGTAPYQYFWSTEETTDTISELKPGIYFLTVEDSGGCRDSVQTIINDFSCTLFAEVATGNPICSGDASGWAQLGITGGVFPVTTIWSHDTTLQSIEAQQLSAGRYDVTIVDDIGCRHTLPFQLTDPPLLEVTVAIEHQSEPLLPDGQISVIAQGGTPGYTYRWEQGSTTPTISGLEPGAYPFTVSDSRGCIWIDTAVILPTDTCLLQISSAVSAATCDGRQGEVLIELENVRGIPTLIWPTLPGTTSFIVEDLAGGSYPLEATDDVCTVRDTIFVPVDSILGIRYEIDRDLCDTEATTRLVLGAVAGGQGPYDIILNGETLNPGASELQLDPGTYSLQVRDQSGCQFEEELIIEGFSAFDLPPDTTIKRGQTIRLAAFFERSPEGLQYRWYSNGQTICEQCTEIEVSPDLTSVYRFEVRDIRGCVVEDKVSIIVEQLNLLYIPNVVTPNGDGINDSWVVYDGRALVEVIETVALMDKNGMLIYGSEAVKPDEEMPGLREILHELVAPDVIMYQLRVRFKDGRLSTYRGDISVLK